MKNKLLSFILLFLFGLGTNSFAQNNQTGETYQPNIRGSLLFGVGLNMFENAPPNFEISPWRSKSVNIYYLYNIPLGQSRFSFHPGIGLGLERYQIRGSYTLAYTDPENIPDFNGSDRLLIMAPLQNVYASGTYQRNRLVPNYIDIPLEFSFASNRANPKAGLKIAMGGKIGVLFDSKMKVRYEDSFDESVTVKTKRPWDLNPIRYSAHTRIGYGGFNIYFEYQFSPLFNNEHNGPLHRSRVDAPAENFVAPYEAFPRINNFRAGIALDLF